MCKLLPFAMVALVTAFALALPTETDSILVQTVDTTKLSQLNILPVLDFLNTGDSRKMSHDNSSLQLAEVHFTLNPTSSTLTNLTLMDTHTKLDAATVSCGNPTCATGNDRKWANTKQPLSLSSSACKFITQNAKKVPVVTVSMP